MAHSSPINSIFRDDIAIFLGLDVQIYVIFTKNKKNF